MSGESSHREVVRREFGIQAARFDKYLSYLDHQDIVGWISSRLDLQPHFSVLDVATGTGLLARAIAPHVRRVVGLDATPEMLHAGRQQAHAEALRNAVFEEGDAEHLPYPNDSFDLVTSRIAMHHFQHPLGPAREMARVCLPGGQVAIIDITSSRDAKVAAAHNRLERLRDPSHSRAMHIDGLGQMAKAIGLDMIHTSTANVDVHLEKWMDLTDTPPDARVAIRQALEEELAGGVRTGMRPSRRDGDLMFSQTWVIVVGRKPSSSSSR